MWIADLFSPAREKQFLTLLQGLASLGQRAAHEFNKFVQTGSADAARSVKATEDNADEYIVKITNALRDSFVTPIDRQDIYNLAEAIDDMIDYLNNAAAEIQLFNVEITEPMKRIAERLEAAAKSADEAVRHLVTDPEAAWKEAERCADQENRVEDIYRHALAELFEGGDTEHIFKLREIYRHLSNSADRAQAIGRLVGKIVVKAS